MAEHRSPRSRAPARAVTADRAGRLYRLLKNLAKPQSRPNLLKKLKLDVRGFYRDLEVLRAFGIRTKLEESEYSLVGGFDEALKRLPFPDPRLNLSEAMQLAKGRTAAHRSLQEQIQRITGPTGSRKL
jgi:hypothetical protein